jgi:hypothetical protein
VAPAAGELHLVKLEYHTGGFMKQKKITGLELKGLTFILSHFSATP